MFAIGVAACKKSVSLTANEQNGITEVETVFGGSCDYAKTAGAAGATKLSFFEMKLKNSDVAAQFADDADLVAANMAYLLFKNLKEERGTYTDIKCTLVEKGSEGDDPAYFYPAKQLAQYEQKIPTVEQIINLVKVKNFVALDSLLRDDYLIYSKKELLANIEKLENELGPITGLQPFGFRSFKDQNGKDILHATFLVLRGNQSSKFSADFDVSDTNPRPLFIQYKF